MDQSTYEMRFASWKALVEECHARPKGCTAKQWLVEHGVSEKQYYYWQRRIRKAAFEEAAKSLPSVNGSAGIAFAEVPFRSAPGGNTVGSFRPDIVIRTAKATIELSNSASDQLLSRILGGLSHV